MKTIRTLTLLSACGGALLAPPLPAQARFETLSTFTGTNPIGVTAVGGLVYGAAAYLSPFPTQLMCGTLFELQPPASPGEPWVQTAIYTFDNMGSSGCIPSAAPIQGPGGVLYGTATYGGAYGDGVLYQLQPPSTPGGAWTETVLYSFEILNAGTAVAGPPVPGPSGSLYCIAAGGAYGYGALVQLLPPTAPGGAWTQAVLYNFDYYSAAEGLLPGPDGILYGANGAGPILQLNPPAAPGGSWTETVLYTLTRSDGITPTYLTLASDGTLYGVTWGSNFGYGGGRATVFQLTPPTSAGGSWTFTLLRDFGAQFGINLNSPLLLRDGNLYGTVTSATGGQVFELQPPAITGGAWTLVHLHQFTGNQLPGGTLVMDKNGGIFGVTAAPYNQTPGGTVYRLATK